MLLLTIILISVSFVSSDIQLFSDCASGGWSCENDAMIYDCRNGRINQYHYHYEYLSDIQLYIWYKQFSSDKHQFIVRNCNKLVLYVDQISVLQFNETNRQVTVENVQELQMKRSSIAAGTPVMLPDVIKLQNIPSLSVSADVINSTNKVLLHLINSKIVSNNGNIELSDLPRLSLCLEKYPSLYGYNTWNFQGLHGLSILDLQTWANIVIRDVNQVVMKKTTFIRHDFGYSFPAKTIKINEVSQLHIEGISSNEDEWHLSGTSNSTINILQNYITNHWQVSIENFTSVNISNNRFTYLRNLYISAKKLTISDNNIERVQDNSFDCDIVNITSNTINKIDSRGLFIANINQIAHSTINIINNTITEHWQDSYINGGSIHINSNTIKYLNKLNIFSKGLSISNNDIEQVEDNSFDCDTINITSNSINKIDTKGFLIVNINQKVSEVNIINNNITELWQDSVINGAFIHINNNSIKYLNILNISSKQLSILNNNIEHVENNSFDCDIVNIISNNINKIDSIGILITNQKWNKKWIEISSVSIRLNIITDYWQNIVINGHSIDISRNQINHLKNMSISAKELTILSNNIEKIEDNSFDSDIVNISSNTINTLDRRGLFVVNNNKTIVENNKVVNISHTGITLTSEYVGITGNQFQHVQDHSLIFNVNNPHDEDYSSYFISEFNYFKTISPNAHIFYHQFYHVVIQNNTFLCRCGNLDWFENLHTSKSINGFNQSFVDTLLSTNNDNKCLNRDCFIRYYVDHLDHLCRYNGYQPDNCTIDEDTATSSSHQIQHRPAITGQANNKPHLSAQTNFDEKSVKSNQNAFFETANYTVYHQLQLQHSPSPLLTSLLVCILIALSVLILMKVKCKNMKYSHIVSWSKTNSNLQQQTNIDDDHDGINVSESSQSL